jgi:hypothetical protein
MPHADASLTRRGRQVLVDRIVGGWRLSVAAQPASAASAASGVVSSRRSSTSRCRVPHTRSILPFVYGELIWRR